MNFNLFALFAAALVSAQGSTLQACNGDEWNSQLVNSYYVDKVEGFVTTENIFVKRSKLPAKHRVVGGKYAGDFQYIQDRLTINVDETNNFIKNFPNPK
ncbi:hypothetical protein CONCODRAFT_13615 [Conidiobolus coronatus NRRL 28638]|uniref:Uncharacterized protein n=1 Tax=Conidiobolus coronatus (strain ATCC 28846 / CBS 209.66 / NRRL 28638) TaxID=796925 RepID=A0A137NQD2_CONC2|nr:hypothetical protein CONCODRAFT_13615 [Conidiobolus coronatus NRRL 28638]|eukprot:KXN64973.1 hypothetical protein CONCODRAFT_13615 [Conidiobolus coronatus NRRL 28638]